MSTPQDRTRTYGGFKPKQWADKAAAQAATAQDDKPTASAATPLQATPATPPIGANTQPPPQAPESPPSAPAVVNP